MVSRILRRELVAVFAVGFGGIDRRTTNPAKDIRAVGHRLQVLRVYASGIAAQVIEHVSS
jgi:hypothetical protein